MVRHLIFGLLLVISLKAISQNSFFFSHYMLNPTYYNPAWVGIEREAFAAFNYRNQWTGYSSSFDGSGGAPNTQMLTLAVPVRSKVLSALTLNASNDNLGPVTNFQIQVSLSHTISFRSGNLGIGIAPSLFSQTQKFDELRFNDPSDPLNIGSRETQVVPDIGAGFLFQNSTGFLIGASIINGLEPSFDFGFDSLENIQVRSYVLHSSKPFRINSDLSLVPNVIVRSDLNSWTFDLGAILHIDSRMWAGASYRKEEALSLLFGYKFLEDQSLHAGYAFDYVISNQEAKQITSHDIFIRYNLPDLVFGGRKSVKTPRFSF